MQAEAVSESMKRLSDNQFGLGVPAPDRREIPPPFWRHVVERRSLRLADGYGSGHVPGMAVVGGRLRERRWVVVAEDGRYVTLGQETDPTEEEIRESEEALRTQGLSGWLAIMEGSPFVGAMPELLEVRALASPLASFAEGRMSWLEVIRQSRI